MIFKERALKRKMDKLNLRPNKFVGKDDLNVIKKD